MIYSQPQEAVSQPESEGRRASVALDWWMRHCDPLTAGPGTAAQLRRCRTPLETATIPAALDLCRRMRAFDHDQSGQYLIRVLDLARLLAFVKTRSGLHPMRVAGWRTFAGDRKESEAGDDRPLLSEARFRRLMAAEDGEELVGTFRRLIQLLGNEVNIEVLSADFLKWNHPFQGERIRRTWAEEYYAARTGLRSREGDDQSVNNQVNFNKE